MLRQLPELESCIVMWLDLDLLPCTVTGSWIDLDLRLTVLSLGLREIYVIITKAFELSKLSLFSNYKVMLPLCHLRVKLNSKHNCWNSHMLLRLLLNSSC